MFRKILKWSGLLLLALVLIALVAGLIIHQPKPRGEEGPAAEALADRMLAAIDYPAWDSTRFVAWTFMGVHHFFWDKERDLCLVEWGDKRVLLRLNEVRGKAWVDGTPAGPEEERELVQSAWAYFCNDSFWLNAPAKVYDPGTRRRLVRLEDGVEALLVEYTSGGVTPGDSYLWVLDERGRPKAWRMWVSVLPVGGLRSSWEAWQTLSTGAQVATRREAGPFAVVISNLKGGMTLADMDRTEDPFAAL